MRAIALTGCLMAAATAAQAQTVDLATLMATPTAGSIQYDRAARISPERRLLIKQTWSDAYYFGAFAEHPDGSYGYSNDANSVAGAEASALRYCADVSDNDGRCRIVAWLMPKGLEPADYPTISPALIDGIVEVHGLNEQGFAALASSGDGAWGSSLNARTSTEAIGIALDSCEEWRTSGEQTPLTGFRCQVIAVMHSSEPLPPRR